MPPQRLITSRTVLQLREYLAQDWPLGFSENNHPKVAVVLKMLLSVASVGCSFCQLMGLIKVGRREVTMRRLGTQDAKMEIRAKSD
jgi:hypothetical protein